MIGPETIVKYARLLGLGSITNIDLPSEAKGSIPDRPKRSNPRDSRWYNGDILNVSIGQGDVLVTPLQLVKMMSTIAKNGDEINPHLIKSVGGREVDRNLASKHVDFEEEALKIVNEGIKGVVEDPSGTAHILNIENLEVRGKTGTAQTSGGRDHHAWFVGFCPTSKTKIAFCVFLEFGGSSFNACFIARDLLLKMQAAQIL